MRFKFLTIFPTRTQRPTFWYTVNRTNRSVNISFFLAVCVWLAQELWLREKYPTEHFIRLNRGFDILSVLWGSFITGYIFHLLVDHGPEKRQDFEEETFIQGRLNVIFRQFRELLFETLKKIPRDSSVAESIYPGKGTRNLMINRMVDVWMDETDFEMAAQFNRINSFTKKILDEPNVPLDVYRVLRTAKVSLPAPFDRAAWRRLSKERLVDLAHRQAMLFGMLHVVLEDKSERGLLVSKGLHRRLESVTYQQIWTEIANSNEP